jgi:hypothetical protein
VIAAIAILASLLADALLFATLAELIAAGYTQDPHAMWAWGFCVVALAGYAVPRLIEGFELGERLAIGVAGGAGLLLIYGLVRMYSAGDLALWDLGWVASFLQDAETTTESGGHALMATMLLIATWVRASLRASDEIEMETIPKSFALPFAFVTVFVVFGALTDRSGEIGRAGAAFYAAAIVSLACSQLALSGATYGEVRAGSTAGVLLAATAGVAIGGLLIVGLLTAVLGPVVGPVISGAVEWTLTIILTPFAWLLTKFFEAVFAGANPFEDLAQVARTTSREAGNPEDSERSAAGRAGLFFMRTVALIVFLALAALFVTVFVRLRNRRAARGADAHQVGLAGSFREDMGSMFRSLFRRQPSRPAGYATTEATRLYLEVLARAESEGHSRPAGETAREFAPELHETFATPVTDDITRAFEAARYGGREPDPRMLADLRERWRQVH